MIKMQSRNLFLLLAFSAIITLALGVKLLNRNSVFSAENFVKKESEKIDDLLEKQRLANRATNEIKRKSKKINLLEAVKDLFNNKLIFLSHNIFYY